eukprot:c11811_g1_i1 orf=123-752(+)
MAEERKKMLEALVAKRKAEAEGGGRSAKNLKNASLLSKPASAKKSSPIVHKPKPSSPHLKQQKQQHHKKESPPKKKKRVEKYDSDDEDGSDEDSDSEDEPVKKKVPSSKLGSSGKPLPVKSAPFKGKQDVKGKAVVKGKESVKGKRKNEDSSDDEDRVSGDEDEEAGEPDSGDEGLDTTNILPGRTRRRGGQPVHYDFTNMSGDDDDSD